jgi:hypothetical protein
MLVKMMDDLSNTLSPPPPTYSILANIFLIDFLRKFGGGGK